MPMPPPEDSEETGGHITGLGMCKYMETFYTTFLKNKVKFAFETEITSVRRIQKESWEVKIKDLQSQVIKVLSFARIVLATGVRVVLSSDIIFGLTRLIVSNTDH